ncbi:MAG TPA: hypothetical protein DHN33_03465, partial [Eubacteriaceae bacterium]|nr:hypothetical protein [Eubacteriaceae bacterium]
MGKAKEVTEKIKGGWTNIDRGKKTGLAVTVGLFILFIAAYSWYSGRVEYVPLFTNLELNDSANIVSDLDARGDIDYRLENGGKDIYV